ncbi:uncharacterized protein [Macrobrachium rosenbergii]|uniref:uncharacterized protein n=1 Tax=Macrobrachium rosenbergii TaxID=79674 RepID=UPI0034D5B8F5
MKVLIALSLVAIVFAKPKPSAEPRPERDHGIELLGGLDFSHGSTGLNTGYDGGHGGLDDLVNGGVTPVGKRSKDLMDYQTDTNTSMGSEVPVLILDIFQEAWGMGDFLEEGWIPWKIA